VPVAEGMMRIGCAIREESVVLQIEKIDVSKESSRPLVTQAPLAPWEAS